MNTDQTFGQKAVGSSFNPSSNPEVDIIKQNAAQLIDQLAVARDTTTDGEKKRMYSLAITAAQESSMWGVKAATW